MSKPADQLRFLEEKSPAFITTAYSCTLDKPDSSISGQDVAISNPQTGLALVADGAGGHEDSQIIAQRTASIFETLINQSTSQDFRNEEDCRYALLQAAAHTQEHFRDDQYSRLNGITTLAAAKIVTINGIAYHAVISAGDSEIVLVRDKKAEQLVDLQQQGEYSITSYFGVVDGEAGDFANVQVRLEPAQDGDRIYVFTDGVTKPFGDIKRKRLGLFAKGLRAIGLSDKQPVNSIYELIAEISDQNDLIASVNSIAEQAANQADEGRFDERGAPLVDKDEVRDKGAIDDIGIAAYEVRIAGSINTAESAVNYDRIAKEILYGASINSIPDLAPTNILYLLENKLEAFKGLSDLDVKALIDFYTVLNRGGFDSFVHEKASDLFNLLRTLRIPKEHGFRLHALGILAKKVEQNIGKRVEDDVDPAYGGQLLLTAEGISQKVDAILSGEEVSLAEYTPRNVMSVLNVLDKEGMENVAKGYAKFLKHINSGQYKFTRGIDQKLLENILRVEYGLVDEYGIIASAVNYLRNELKNNIIPSQDQQVPQIPHSVLRRDTQIKVHQDNATSLADPGIVLKDISSREDNPDKNFPANFARFVRHLYYGGFDNAMILNSDGNILHALRQLYHLGFDTDILQYSLKLVRNVTKKDN